MYIITTLYILLYNNYLKILNYKFKGYIYIINMLEKLTISFYFHPHQILNINNINSRY